MAEAYAEWKAYGLEMEGEAADAEAIADEHLGDEP
jgi:hypothetical protein